MNLVVTGASRGIGMGIAKVFAEGGFNIAVCSRNSDNLNLLKEEIKQVNPKARCYTFICDVSKKTEILDFADHVLANLNTIDVLVNNAGVFLPGSLLDQDETVFEKTMQTNLFSAYYFTKALLPRMIRQRSGHIFNMCSVASLQAYPGGGIYSVSKFALLGLSKSLREELKTHNIRVTSIMPGATLTDSWKGTDLPEERFMSVEDVAKCVYDIYSLSERTVVEDVVLRPLQGDI